MGWCFSNASFGNIIALTFLSQKIHNRPRDNARATVYNRHARRTPFRAMPFRHECKRHYKEQTQMAFRHGTDIAKVEYTVATLPPSKVHVCESSGEIPPNLADISNLVIEAHRANGDLAWLSDMIGEAEEAAFNAKYEALLGHITPEAAKVILEAVDHNINPVKCGSNQTDIREDLLAISLGQR